MAIYDVKWFFEHDALLQDDGFLATPERLPDVSNGDYYALCMIYGIEYVMYPPERNEYGSHLSPDRKIY